MCPARLATNSLSKLLLHRRLLQGKALVASDSLAQVAAPGGGAFKDSPPTSSINIPFKEAFADENERALIDLRNINTLKLKAEGKKKRKHTQCNGSNNANNDMYY